MNLIIVISLVLISTTGSKALSKSAYTNATIATAARGSGAPADRLDVVQSCFRKQAFKPLEVDVLFRESLGCGRRVLELRLLRLPLSIAELLNDLLDSVGEAIGAVAQLYVING